MPVFFGRYFIFTVNIFLSDPAISHETYYQSPVNDRLWTNVPVIYHFLWHSGIQKMTMVKSIFRNKVTTRSGRILSSLLQKA